MKVRIRKSFKIAKGVRVNVGKRGTSVSFGGKGFTTTLHSSGKVTQTMSVKGTGISFVNTTNLNSPPASHSSAKNIADNSKIDVIDAQKQHLDTIKRLHLTIPFERMVWSEVINELPPFDRGSIGPKEYEAKENLSTFKPSFIQKLLPFLENKERKKLIDRVEEARMEDQNEYSEWLEKHELAKVVLNWDKDSIKEALYKMFPLERFDICDNFEFIVCQNTIEVDVWTSSIKAIPEFEYYLTPTGRLSKKVRTKTNHFIYQRHCLEGIALFILLAIEYGFSPQEIRVNVYDCSETDRIERLLSVAATTEELKQIDYKNETVSEVLEQLRHHIKHVKTKGLRPVEKVSMITDF